MLSTLKTDVENNKFVFRSLFQKDKYKFERNVNCYNHWFELKPNSIKFWVSGGENLWSSRNFTITGVNLEGGGLPFAILKIEKKVLWFCKKCPVSIFEFNFPLKV